MQKSQLKVKMCWTRREEKLIGEIREVPGVFHVSAERSATKVVVVAMPFGFNEYRVLKKARTVHKKAKFVELEVKEKPNKEEQDEERPKRRKCMKRLPH